MNEIPKVVILATCRKPELLPATLLVFKTIRVGFPTAKITTYGNGLRFVMPEVEKAARSVQSEFLPASALRHDEWVQQMIWNNDHPFVICDTDMIFFDKVEDWQFDQPLAGYLQPEYFEPFTKTIYRTRLHTSLLFIRPDEVRDRMLRFDGKFPKAPILPVGINFIGQQYQPVRMEDGKVRTYFMDTAAVLYHAIGGNSFSPQQLDCYAHLHAGTWSDLLSPQMRAMHEELMANPDKARGMWRGQEEFYSQHPVPK